MSEVVARQVQPVWGFVERSWRLVQRYWAWEVMWLVYSLAMTLSIGFLAKGMALVSGADLPTNKVLIYLLTGSLVWRYLSEIFGEVSNIISWERWEGTLEYTFMAPISRATHLLGMTAFSVSYAGLRFLLVLGLCAVFFDLDLRVANVPGALAVLAASTLSLMGLGLMGACMPMLSPEKGSQATGIIQALLLMVSGIYYPIEVLPVWMQHIATVSPVTYALRGMRGCLIEGIGMRQVWAYVWPLLIVGAVLIPMGLQVFAVAERYCKRKGMLKRSG